MPATLQELRPDDTANALAFIEGCGCALPQGRIVPGLSLIATEEDAIVAAAICVFAGHRHQLAVAHPTEGIDPELHRLLVDKALMKLRGAGIRACELTTNGSADNAAFFGAVSWIGQAIAEAA